MEYVPVPVLTVCQRGCCSRERKDVPVWSVLSIFEDVANQVEILVFFVSGMLARSLVFGSLFGLELDIRAAGRAKFCC